MVQPAGELLEQVPSILALQEGQVAKDVDGILLIDRASPEVGQPFVVRLDVHRVGKRAIGRVLEDVCVTEMEVGREIDLVFHIQNVFLFIFMHLFSPHQSSN